MLLSAPSPHHQPQSLHLNKENSQPRRVSSRHRSTTSSKLLLSSAVPKSTRTSTLKPHLSSGSPYARTPSTPPASPKKKTSKLSSSLKTPVASSPARTSSSRSQQASVGLVNAPPITSSSSSLSSRMPTSEEQHQMRYGGPVVMDRGSGSSFLPLSLPRPERVAQIDVPTVEELEGVPYAYVLERLAQSGPSLLQSALSSHLAHGSSTLTPPLPTRLSFDHNPAASINPLTLHPSPPPNYVLAIRPTPSASSSSSPAAGSILPIHSIIYQTFCAHLPPLPPRDGQLPESSLPIINITLPSPATLPTLNTYLYTQRPDILLSTLLALPASAAQAARTRADLTAQLAAWFDVPQLMQRIALVHAVWGNVCALGVADVLLWKAMDTAWEVLVGAMAVRQERKE